MLRNFVLYLIECRGIIPLVIIYYPFLYCWIWFANICLGLLCICVCVWYVSSSNFFAFLVRFGVEFILISSNNCLQDFVFLFFGVPSSLFIYLAFQALCLFFSRHICILFYFIIFTMIFIFSIIADLQCSVSFLLYSGGLDVTDF